MGDSDEEHETRGARRGRDKFRRERSDFSGDRQGRRDGWGGRRPPTDGGRELGTQAGQWERRKRDFGDNRRGGDRPGPRGDSPPMKRRRRDWYGPCSFSQLLTCFVRPGYTSVCLSAGPEFTSHGAIFVWLQHSSIELLALGVHTAMHFE